MSLDLLSQAHAAATRAVPVVLGLVLDSLLPTLAPGSRLLVLEGRELVTGLTDPLPSPIAESLLHEAGKVLSEDEPRFVSFVVPAMLRVFLEPLDQPRRLDAALRARPPCALVTDLASGLTCVVTQTDTEGALGLAAHDLSAVRAVLADGRARALGGDLFVEVLT